MTTNKNRSTAASEKAYWAYAVTACLALAATAVTIAKVVGHTILGYLLMTACFAAVLGGAFLVGYLRTPATASASAGE